MEESSDLKQKIVEKLFERTDEKIENLKKTISTARESLENETKSSVGDKYETGRAMLQLEIEKNSVLLNNAVRLKNELSQIDIHKITDKVEFGSLVQTNYANYFISIGLGKIEIENQIFYDVSMASPIGKILLEKSPGNKIVFQGKEIRINSIF